MSDELAPRDDIAPKDVQPDHATPDDAAPNDVTHDDGAAPDDAAPYHAAPDDAAPSPATTTWSLRAREWMQAERIGWAILLAVLGMPASAFVVWMLDFSRAGWLAALAGVPIAALGLWLLTMPWTRACHRRAGYRLDGQGLGYRHGVLWQHEIHVPRSRIQHTDVTQGPVERRYGLATLVVHTAGTSHARIAIEGLAAEEAHRLRDILVQSTDDDGV